MTETLRLRLKDVEREFEAEGDATTVIQEARAFMGHPIVAGLSEARIDAPIRLADEPKPRGRKPKAVAEPEAPEPPQPIPDAPKRKELTRDEAIALHKSIAIQEKTAWQTRDLAALKAIRANHSIDLQEIATHGDDARIAADELLARLQKRITELEAKA